jgi:CrcB protein
MGKRNRIVAQYLLVGIGGGIGSLARYALGAWILHRSVDWRFPLGTFMVNVLGCAIAGVLAGLVEKHGFFTPDVRRFLFTGVLGGFTTFSAFGVETVALLRRNEVGIAAAYVALSVLCGVGALWLGMKVVESASL